MPSEASINLFRLLDQLTGEVVQAPPNKSLQNKIPMDRDFHDF